MCRHLAYLGPARSLSSLLYEPEHSLEKQSWKPKHQTGATLNADGWGVGWWDPAITVVPARYRTARPMWSDVSFRSVADLVHAGAIVAAARSATPPLPVVETGNAPFAAGEWLFSLNGFVVGFSGELGVELRREVSPARAAAIEGTSDSEVLFSLVLDAMDGGATPADAIVNVTTDVLARAEARLNLLLCDGQQLVATARGSSLFTLEGQGLAEGGVLVASEPLDDHPAWSQLPDATLLEATAAGLRTRPLSLTKGTA